MSFNMYNCKLCGGINSLIKDYNSNLIKCNICDTTIKENDNDEINEFQKYFASNDKTIEYITSINSVSSVTCHNS